jgi:hypothetical protein
MKAEQGAQRMPTQSQAWRWIPWAWSLSWLLTGLGFWISVVNSLLPPPNFIAYIAMSALGWVIAGVVTASAARGTPGMHFRLAGWLVAGMASISLSILWMLRWDAGFLGPIAALGVAGTIGGVAGSMRRGAWRWVSGILLGVLFLLLATLSFYSSYFLMFVATAVSRHGGDIRLIDPLGWVIPGAVFGLTAGFLVRWILGLQRP